MCISDSPFAAVAYNFQYGGGGGQSVRPAIVTVFNCTALVRIYEYINSETPTRDVAKEPMSLLGSGLRALGVLKIPDGMEAAAALPKDMPFYAIKEKLASTGEEVRRLT